MKPNTSFVDDVELQAGGDLVVVGLALDTGAGDQHHGLFQLGDGDAVEDGFVQIVDQLIAGDIAQAEAGLINAALDQMGVHRAAGAVGFDHMDALLPLGLLFA